MWMVATLGAAALGATEPGPLPAELARAQAWVQAKLLGQAPAVTPEPGLLVLANHDPVIRNERLGRPLNLAGAQFTRGLYCHATSAVLVRLPGPGARFTAQVGVDRNEQTSGRGSVRFAVKVGERELVRTPLLREGQPPVAVAVDLHGARELLLEVADGGDGIACDQADWADALVTLVDGREVWLGDLPFVTDPRQGLTGDPPFAFEYGGKPVRQQLAEWRVERSQRALDEHRTAFTTTWTDPVSRIEVRLEAVAYRDFPTVEWTVKLRHGGTGPSPLIAGLQGLDEVVGQPAEGGWTVRHHVGSVCEQRDFQPLAARPTADQPLHLASAGGRPTDGYLPYFNLARADGGVLLAIGWPGQWAAEFAAAPGHALRVTAGQEQTRFVLRPGETVRSPLLVLQWYQGSPAHAQNVWRRWMVAHNVPRVAGQLPPLHHAACSSHQYAEMIQADEACQTLFIDRYLGEGLKLDYWWMDAGWYPNRTGWPNTGTWEVDATRFPRGLRAITDHGHAQGVGSIVWFEPERVTPGTWLWEQHPEWLLRHEGASQALLNLGDPAARAWLTDHVDRLLTEQGIDLYRQDFNIAPLRFWRDNDAPDRQGLTEQRYVTGYLAYWDELLRRHPRLRIDSCASGGRRNDLETLRRAVPLLRSDYIFEPIGQQCHTLGLAPWVPYFGTGVRHTDAYTARSAYNPAINTCWDLRPADGDYAGMRARVAEWRRLEPYWLGDFYDLLPYSREDHVWAAWQYHEPGRDAGAVQVFRRAESAYETARLRLQGLDPVARYRLTDVDGGERRELSGRELSEPGWLVRLAERPGSAMLFYERAR